MNAEEVAELVLDAVDSANIAKELSDEPMEDVRSGGMAFFFDLRVGDQWFTVSVAKDPRDLEDGAK